MNNIRHHFTKHLQAVEQEEHVRILYACESGSRAWGVHSEASDYDVRFIYIRPVEWYLSIFDKRDVIERPIHSAMDINGWDLKKALQLIRKSNPSLLEWLESPIVYMERFSVAEQIRSISPLLFSPKSCTYHYLHMAKRNYRIFLQQDQVQIKKYFYVLRPILACQWIEQYRTMPPLEFGVLVERLVPDGSELKKAIQHLLDRKKDGGGTTYEPSMIPIHRFLEEKIAYYDKAADAMEARQEEQDDRLDALFRSALKDVWQTNNQPLQP
ncbi:nucleotidyltransferase domain-containing protein [Paenibacillus allorhizosphaerae]|uniref:Nucleotidyltransferase domain-containing protein n=1 Tax=Paenibacillus allorhizosphaerae TaxID=2849866 RepID=A0ABN7TPL0_9BACL|nr:nucleotidyltransferase domain-containing protein [Paenibacillus allorhizosphaerae]CAG7645279.1 hypothetical protein PAECIP111802_03477 [Paenibacillus allorhizosphaerae]